MNITENHPNEPQIWRVLLDKEFKAKLKIVKKDDETKKSVLIAGTEFKVYDLDNKKYVEQVTTYPVTTTHKSYFTDSQGYLIMPKNLKIGHYRIEEVNAPEGTQSTRIIWRLLLMQTLLIRWIQKAAMPLSQLITRIIR